MKNARKLKKAARKAKLSKLKRELKKVSKQAEHDREMLKKFVQAAEQDRHEANKRFEEQDEARKQYEEELDNTNRLLTTTVQSTVLPIIAAIVYKEIYRIGFGHQSHNQGGGGDRRVGLLSNNSYFKKFGMNTNEEMEIFARTVSSRTSCWNETMLTLLSGRQPSPVGTLQSILLLATISFVCYLLPAPMYA